MGTTRSKNVSSDIAIDVEVSKLNEKIALITFSMVVQHMLMGTQHMLLGAQHMLMGTQHMLLVAQHMLLVAQHMLRVVQHVRQCKIKAISASN